PTTVSRGQTGIAVSVRARNAGQAAANITGVLVLFRRDHIPRDPDYTQRPFGTNPAQIPGGATASLGVVVDVSPLASIGPVTLDARLAATDAHSGVDATVEGAQQTDTWTVQTPAQLRLDEVTAQAVVVAPGQSGVPVTLTVTNAGEAAARITAAALVFRASPSSYTATRTDTVTSLAGGATATLSFAVDVAATTPAGTETLDAAVTAADVHSGQDASDPHADATASWLVASPGSATAFRIEFIPGDPGAGIPVGSFHDILLTAITPSGEVATDYVGNVLLASSDTQAFFHGTEVAFSRADAGVRRLPDLGVFRSPGSHTVTATDLVFPALTATVLAQVVTAPVRMSLLSGGRNELVSVGRKPTPVTVQVFDGFDQPVQGAVVRVVLDGVGALSVTTTATGTARLDLPQPFMVGTVQATVSLPDHPQIPAVTYTIEVRRVEILAELTPDGTLRLTVDGQLHPDVDAVTVAGQATVRVPGTNTFVLTSPPLAEGKGILDVKITRSDGSVLERVVDVVKDTAPPIARLLSPFDGAVELPLPAAFVVEFGERISPFSVTPDTFSLAAEGGVPVLGDLEFSATGTTVVFMPTQPLPPAASLQLLLTSGIEDLAGNALAPANFRFTSATTDPPQAPPPGTGQAIHLTPVDGGGQFDETVNRPAHRPIVMFASDQDGRPLNGIPLRFEVYRGNATFFESDGLTAITGAAGPGLGGLNLLFGSEVGEVRVRVEAAHGSAQASDEVFLAARNPHFDMGLGNDPTARAGEIVGHLNLLLCEPRCGSGIANASVEFLSTGDPNDPDIEIFPNPATTDRAGRIEAILIGRRPGTHAVTIRFPDFPAAELRQFALLDRLLGPRTIRVDVSGEPPFLGAPVPLISNRNEDWDRNLVTVLRLVRRASLTTLSPPVQVATGVTPVTFSVQVLNDFGHPVIGREEFQVLLDSVEAQLLRVAAPLRTEEVDQDVPGTFRTFGLSDPLMLNLELFTFAGEPGRANVQPAPESLPTEAERLFAPPETAFRRMVRTDGAGRLVASATPVEPLRRPMEVAFHSHPENLTAEGVVLLETGGFQTNLNAFGSFLRDLVIPRFQAAVDEAHRGLPGGSGLIFRMVPRYLQLTGTGPSPDETAIHEVMAQDVSRFAPEGPIPDEAFWLNYFDAPGTAAEAFTVEISGIDREGAIFEADGRFPEPAVRVDLERVDETTRHTHFRSVRPVLALQNSTSEAIPTDQLRVYPLRSLAGGTIDAALPSAGPPTTPGRWPVRVAAPSADVLLSARSLDEDDLVVVEAIAPAGLGGVNYQYFGPDGVRRTRWAAETVEEFFTPMAERVAVCQDLLSVRGRTRPGEILSVELDDPLVSAAGASGDAMRIDAIDVDFVDAVDGLPIATLPLTSLLNGPAEPRDEAGRPIPVYSFALTVEGSQISRLLLVSYAIDKETVIDSEVVDAFAPVRLVIEETLPGDGLLRGVFGGLVEASHPDGTPFEEAAPPVPGEGGLVEFPDGGAPQLFGSYLGIMVKRTDIGEQKRIGNFRIPDPHDPARGIDVYMEVLSLRTRRGQMGDRMIEVIDLNPYKIIDPNVRVLAKVTEKGKLERFRSPFISEDDERWINAYVEQNSEPFFDLSDETKFQLALIFHTFGGDLDTAREIAERIRNGEREVDVLGGTVSREAFFGAIGGALGQIGKRAGRLALQKFNATVDRFYGSFRGKWSPGASPVGHTAERLATSATETLDDHVARHAQEFDELAPSLRGLKKSAEKPRTIPGRRPTFVELESDGTLPPGVVNEQRQLVTQEYLEIALSYLNHRRSDPSKHIQVFEFEKAGVRMRHVFDLDKAVFASGNVTTGEVATCFRPAPRALTDAGVPVTEIPVQFLRLETKVYMKKQELELAKYGYLEIR
ncbi:MAG: Ig-like domain-containing protein, partial [Planctomycetes bacterium]|nr:Ig-like domain-containing protein [Planctomycetota bacterium]